VIGPVQPFVTGSSRLAIISVLSSTQDFDLVLLESHALLLRADTQLHPPME
jgi:hypothetical protein